MTAELTGELTGELAKKTAPELAGKLAQKLTRRDMLKTTWAALGGLVALEMGGLSFAYLQPRLAAGEFGAIITAGAVADFPPGSVTHIPNGRFYLARLQGCGGRLHLRAGTGIRHGRAIRYNGVGRDLAGHPPQRQQSAQPTNHSPHASITLSSSRSSS